MANMATNRLLLLCTAVYCMMMLSCVIATTIFECVEYNECSHEILECAANEECKVYCTGDHTCGQSLIQCPQSAECSVHCMADDQNSESLCTGLTINATRSTHLSVKASANLDTLRSAVAFCPFQGKCKFHGEGTHVMTFMDIFAINGFRDVSIKCDDCYMGDLYCTPEFEQNCHIVAADNECQGPCATRSQRTGNYEIQGSICNDYEYTETPTAIATTATTATAEPTTSTTTTTTTTATTTTPHLTSLPSFAPTHGPTHAPSPAQPLTVDEDVFCLVDDVMYSNGSSISVIGYTCIGDRQLAGKQTFCIDGEVVVVEYSGDCESVHAGARCCQYGEPDTVDAAQCITGVCNAYEGTTTSTTTATTTIATTSTTTATVTSESSATQDTAMATTETTTTTASTDDGEEEEEEEELCSHSCLDDDDDNIDNSTSTEGLSIDIEIELPSSIMYKTASLDCILYDVFTFYFGVNQLGAFLNTFVVCDINVGVSGGAAVTTTNSPSLCRQTGPCFIINDQSDSDPNASHSNSSSRRRRMPLDDAATAEVPAALTVLFHVDIRTYDDALSTPIAALNTTHLGHFLLASLQNVLHFTAQQVYVQMLITATSSVPASSTAPAEEKEADDKLGDRFALLDSLDDDLPDDLIDTLDQDGLMGHFSGTRDQWICVGVFLAILVLLFPFAVYYTQKLNALRLAPFIHARRPGLNVWINYAGILFLMVERPLHAIHRLSVYSALWFEWLRLICYFTAMQFLAGWVILRFWLLLFDIKWNKSMTNQDWKSKIDLSLANKNSSFFRRSRKTWGNMSFIWKYFLTVNVFLSAIPAFFTFAHSYFLGSLAHGILLGVCVLLLAVLWRTTPVYHDEFKIMQECGLVLFWIGASICTHVVLSIMKIVFRETFWIWFLSYSVPYLLLSGVIFIQSHWALSQMQRSRQQTVMPNSPCRTCSLSAPAVDADSNHSRTKSGAELAAQLQSNMTLQQLMADKLGCYEFIAHLLSEFSCENMLSVIEMTQYKQFFLKWNLYHLKKQQPQQAQAAAAAGAGDDMAAAADADAAPKSFSLQMQPRNASGAGAGAGAGPLLNGRDPHYYGDVGHVDAEEKQLLSPIDSDSAPDDEDDLVSSHLVSPDLLSPQPSPGLSQMYQLSPSQVSQISPQRSLDPELIPDALNLNGRKSSSWVDECTKQELFAYGTPFVRLPKEVPRSTIVWNVAIADVTEQDVRDKIVAIYEKYVRSGCEFEVNLSYRLRKETTQRAETVEELNAVELYTFFDAVIESLVKLMHDSFTRFRMTKGFVIYERQFLDRGRSNSMLKKILSNRAIKNAQKGNNKASH